MVARLTSIVVRYQKVAVSSTVTLIFLTRAVAQRVLTRLDPCHLSSFHVRPATATTTGRWVVRIHDTRVDVHRHGAVWLDDGSTTIRIWRHSKPVDLNWHGSVWVDSAAAIRGYFWIYHDWGSRDGSRRWLVWIHESSAAAAATTTATATATTEFTLW